MHGPQSSELAHILWKIKKYRKAKFRPIKGPEFHIDGLENVKFQLNLDGVSETTANVVCKGTAAAGSPCWLPLKVTVSPISHDLEKKLPEVSQKISTFTESCTTKLEIELPGNNDDLTISVRLEELLGLSTNEQPEEILQVIKIATSVETKVQKIKIPKEKVSVARNKLPPLGYRFDLKKNLDWLQYTIESINIDSPVLVTARLSLMDDRGRVRKTEETTHLFRAIGEKWYFPNFIRCNEVNEESDVKLKFFMSAVEPNLRRDRFLIPRMAFSGGCTVVLPSSTQQTCVSSDLLTALKQGRWHDLVLTTQEDVQFKVHRAVLVSRSPFFKAMLEHNFKESTKKVIRISDVHCNEMALLLDFIYGDTFPKDITIDETVKLHTMAEFFGLSKLSQLCVDHLTKEMRISNVLKILPLFQWHQEEDLEKAVLELIAYNASVLVQNAAWWEELRGTLPELNKKFFNYAYENL